MAKTYFLAILEFDHDGNCTPEELVMAVGSTFDTSKLAMDILTVEGITGRMELTACLGVDELQHDQVKELIERRKTYGL